MKGPLRDQLHVRETTAAHVKSPLRVRREFYKYAVVPNSSIDTTKPNKCKDREPSARVVDFMVYDVKIDEIAPTPSPGSRQVVCPRNYPAFMVFEVTDPTNSSVNFNEKMKEYEASGVCQYVIIDQSTFADTGIATAYVHTVGENGKYTRRVYTDDEIVQCVFLEDRNLTPSRMCKPEPTAKVERFPIELGRDKAREQRRRARGQIRNSKTYIRPRLRKIRQRKAYTRKVSGKIRRKRSFAMEDKSGSFGIFD